VRPAEPIDLSVVRVRVWRQMMAFNELQQVRGIQKKGSAQGLILAALRNIPRKVENWLQSETDVLYTVT